MQEARDVPPFPALPPGHRTVPISTSDEGAALRLCVLIRQEPDPVQGRYVILHELIDATIYLGCLVDTGGRVWDWLELWVQNLSQLPEVFPRFLERPSNAALDAQWVARAEAFNAMDPAHCLASGWEHRHPAPTLIDLEQGVSVAAQEKDSGQPWALCTDDAALVAAELPAFSTSSARYLWCRPTEGGSPTFVSLFEGAPQTPQTRRPADAVRQHGRLLPFNLQGGLMLVRAHAPLSYEEHIDGLSDIGANDGGRRGNRPGSTAEDSALFPANCGPAGRLIETFHLKLIAFCQALRWVHGVTQRTQKPFLNLSSQSFRVRPAELGSGLPARWTAQVVLDVPGEAFALRVEGTEFPYFVNLRPHAKPLYLPGDARSQAQGTATVRLRKVSLDDKGRTVLEGTLVAAEVGKSSPHDLLWMRLPLAGQRLDLYGHPYHAEGLARGESRFRTLAQALAQPFVEALRGAEGTSFSQVPFEIQPLLSSPCDLHSLGVLGVRTFLAPPAASLAETLDETLSLARQAGLQGDPSVPLTGRVRAVYESDPRWQEALGPDRLIGGTPESAVARDLLPRELWWELLAALVRLFPGTGADSVCKDWGDAPRSALESVYHQPLRDFEQLITRTRSLLLVDWRYNREVQQLIATMLR